MNDPSSPVEDRTVFYNLSERPLRYWIEMAGERQYLSAEEASKLIHQGYDITQVRDLTVEEMADYIWPEGEK